MSAQQCRGSSHHGMCEVKGGVVHRTPAAARAAHCRGPRRPVHRTGGGVSEVTWPISHIDLLDWAPRGRRQGLRLDVAACLRASSAGPACPWSPKGGVKNVLIRFRSYVAVGKIEFDLCERSIINRSIADSRTTDSIIEQQILEQQILEQQVAVAPAHLQSNTTSNTTRRSRSCATEPKLRHGPAQQQPLS